MEIAAALLEENNINKIIKTKHVENPTQTYFK